MTTVFASNTFELHFEHLEREFRPFQATHKFDFDFWREFCVVASLQNFRVATVALSRYADRPTVAKTCGKLGKFWNILGYSGTISAKMCEKARQMLGNARSAKYLGIDINVI